MKLGIVMDPIATINPQKDTSFAMLLEAERRGWTIYYIEQGGLFLQQGEAFAKMRRLKVQDTSTAWFQLSSPEVAPLADLAIILMRKDPPFDLEYIYTTYLLERAELAGVQVINKPQGLRDVNEKLFTAWFPECCPPTLVARDPDLFRAFLATHGDIILKPLNGMGGSGIMRLRPDDPNISVILELLTDYGRGFAMAQRYLPEIIAGDKRIILIHGKPIPYALARIPAAGETRGNLAAGGRGEGVALTARDYWLCEQVGPELLKRGLRFVGLDVIGDFITEINVTSPTGVRQLEAYYQLGICRQFFEELE